MKLKQDATKRAKDVTASHAPKLVQKLETTVSLVQAILDGKHVADWDFGASSEASYLLSQTCNILESAALMLSMQCGE